MRWPGHDRAMLPKGSPHLVEGFTPMKRPAVLIATALALASLSLAGDDPPLRQAAPAKAEPASRETDEKAIRELNTAFTKAFNAGDAKGLAALFTEDADIIDEEGAKTE